jgi:transposase-like protein
VAAGSYAVVAARLAGVSPSTYYGWRKRAREEIERREAGAEPRREEDRYVRFYLEVDRADAQSEVTSVVNVRRDGKHTWYLERRHRERWGPPTPPKVEREREPSYAEMFAAMWAEAERRAAEDARPSSDASYLREEAEEPPREGPDPPDSG